MKIEKQKTELEFLSTESLAKMLDLKPRWLLRNRSSKYAIPYRKFGRLIRYEKSEVLEWLDQNKKGR